MCADWLFSQGVDLFDLKFYLDRSSPSTILGIRKLETLGYPKVKTASLYIPCFDTILECNRLMDGQTDGFAVAYTTLAILCFAARCSKNAESLHIILTYNTTAHCLHVDYFPFLNAQHYLYKSLANPKRPCGCSALCLHPKSSLCSCPYGPHYGRIVVFSLSPMVETS